MHWWFGMDLSSLPLQNHTTNPITHVLITGASQFVLVIPYLALIAAAMFLQYYQMRQMNSRNPQAAAANPQMQSMQKFFPIIFGVIYLRVPAGATIYMVVSSAMRIGTQEVMFRTGMVTPVAAEREIGSAKETKDTKEITKGTKDAGKPAVQPKSARKPSTATGRNVGLPGHCAPHQTRRVPTAAARRSNKARVRRGANGKVSGEDADDAPAPKAHPRSRSSKRQRKAR